jgi:hypothetical protein
MSRIAWTVLCIVIIALAPVEARSRTLYVEIFGETNTLCSRSRPCDDIADAMGLAAGKDRIVVGPGLYTGSLQVTLPGLKIVSIAGRRATTLFADPSTPALQVEPGADRVVIGQRGKGFTFLGTFDGADGAVVNAARARIEGNAVLGNSTGGDGLRITAAGATVRYNEISGFERGLHLPASMERSRHLVTDNRVSEPSGVCIQMAGARRSANRLLNNMLRSCGAAGISLITPTDDSVTGDLIQNNVIGFGNGAGISIQGGSPRVRRNFISILGIEGVLVHGTVGATIQDNLVDQSVTAFSLGADNPKLVVSGNTVVTTGHAVRIAANAVPPRMFSRNNFYHFTDCAFDFDSTSLQGPILFSRNFWGDLDAALPDHACDEEFNALFTGGILLHMSPSALPNRVRYRGGL